jgi:phosphatidylserine decarboxylase
MRHQYIERRSGRVLDERLFGDRLVGLVYSRLRERSGAMFRAVTGARMSRLLGLLNYDLALAGRLSGARGFLEELGVEPAECREPLALTTPRAVFERKLRYEDCRPLCGPREVASPADSRVLVGSFAEHSALFVKEKFFSRRELLGAGRPWLSAFAGGSFAVFRLTPEKYHYNHAPVSGRVADIYELEGGYHSCNPRAVVSLVTPYSKNRRVVTILDSDAEGGTGVGLVAMVEVVALMIGDIVQCYSRTAYDDPRPVEPGMFLEKGRPKSLFRPGSSTVVLMFQPGRVSFCPDLVANQRRPGVASRFSAGFGQPLAETEVLVRSAVASAAE